MNKRCVTRLLSLLQRERMKMRDCSAYIVRALSLSRKNYCPSPPAYAALRRGGQSSPRKRGEEAEEITKGFIISFLSLSQRERMKVRDYSQPVVQALTKLLPERHQVLRAPDDSRSGAQQSPVWLKISLVPGRVL